MQKYIFLYEYFLFKIKSEKGSLVSLLVIKYYDF